MGHAREDMTATAKARSDVYGLLAIIFRAAPTVDCLEQLKIQGFTDILNSFGQSLGEGVKFSPVEKLAEDLAVEYTRLFIGPGPRLSPHESVHLEIDGYEGGLWGTKTVEVKAFMEATGLEIDDSFGGMPDHLAAELEFMQKLLQKEAEAWTKEDHQLGANILKIEKRFYDEHLSQWVSKFCDKVIDATKHPFYKQFSEVTQGFIDFEEETLRTLLDEASEGHCQSKIA